MLAGVVVVLGARVGDAVMTTFPWLTMIGADPARRRRSSSAAPARELAARAKQVALGLLAASRCVLASSRPSQFDADSTEQFQLAEEH